MTQLRTPNEMFQAAKDMMLDGREPESHRDWQIIMNFFAANAMPEVADSVCMVMSVLYQMPLSEEEIHAIVAFQLERKEDNSNGR